MLHPPSAFNKYFFFGRGLCEANGLLLSCNTYKCDTKGLANFHEILTVFFPCSRVNGEKPYDAGDRRITLPMQQT